MIDMTNLIPIEDVAELLDVSKFTVYRYIKAGKMPAFRVSKYKVLIARDDVNKFLINSRTSNGVQASQNGAEGQGDGGNV